MKELLARLITHLLIYSIGALAIKSGKRIAPTSLAGPGLDSLALLIFGLFAISALVFFLISIVPLKKYSISIKIFILIIHVVSFALFIVWFNQPYYYI